MLEHALELDPKFTEARVNYALTYVIAVEIGLSNEPGDIYRAEEELRKAGAAGSPEAQAALDRGAIDVTGERLAQNFG